VTVLFRLGLFTLGDGYVRIQNRTRDELTGRHYDKTLKLTPDQERRWRLWLERRLRERQNLRV